MAVRRKKDAVTKTVNTEEALDPITSEEPSELPSASGASDEGDLYLTAEQIAKVIGSPLANVRKYWPPIQAALREQKLVDRSSVIAAVAIIANESAEFLPVSESSGGSKSYWNMYEPTTRAGIELGNKLPGDGFKFRGRGFIQLTGRWNYGDFGRRLNLPLEADPELANDPEIAMRIFALWLRIKNQLGDFRAAAAAGQWEICRRVVNPHAPRGDITKYKRFIAKLDKVASKTVVKRKTKETVRPAEPRSLRSWDSVQAWEGNCHWSVIDYTTNRGAGVAVKLGVKVNCTLLLKRVEPFTWRGTAIATGDFDDKRNSDGDEIVTKGGGTCALNVTLRCYLGGTWFMESDSWTFTFPGHQTYRWGGAGALQEADIEVEQDFPWKTLDGIPEEPPVDFVIRGEWHSESNSMDARWELKPTATIEEPLPTGPAKSFRPERVPPRKKASSTKPTATDLARKILKSKNILLASSHVSKVRDQATPDQQVRDAAKGKAVKRSAYQDAPGGSVELDPRLLQFMLDLAERHQIGISEIAGGSHAAITKKSRGSRHYYGVAFDINIIDGQYVSDTNPYVGAIIASAKAAGATQILHPGNDVYHNDHLHIAWPYPPLQKKAKKATVRDEEPAIPSAEPITTEPTALEEAPADSSPALPPVRSYYLVQSHEARVVHFHPRCPGIAIATHDVQQQLLNEPTTVADLARGLNVSPCEICLRMLDAKENDRLLYAAENGQGRLQIWGDRVVLSDGHTVPLIVAASDILLIDPKDPWFVGPPRLIIDYPGGQVDFVFSNKSDRDTAFEALVSIVSL